MLVDVVDDGAGALNDAPSILKQLCLQRRYPKIDADRKGAEIALKRPWGKHQGVEGLRSMSLRVKAIELEAGILFTALLKEPTLMRPYLEGPANREVDRGHVLLGTQRNG